MLDFSNVGGVSELGEREIDFGLEAPVLDGLYTDVGREMKRRGMGCSWCHWLVMAEAD